MSTAATSDVLVRDELFYFADGWAHLSDNRGCELSAQDAALLELVMRGAGDLNLLASDVAAIAESLEPGAIRAALARNLRDPRSLLELVPPMALVEPDVIVCDFSPHNRLVSGRALVRSLRKRLRVLHLGLAGRVRGPLRQNLSMRASERAGTSRGWCQFVQRCRARVRKSPGAVLVLCGPQDHILFGDLVPYASTIAMVDEGWPGLNGPRLLWGDDWIPDDPVDAVRALYYALRFSALEDIEALHRTNSSDLAVLEGYALRHAARVGCAMLDQVRELERIGRTPQSSVFAHGLPMPGRKPARGDARVLVLVTSVERGFEPNLPFLKILLESQEPAAPFTRIMVRTFESWFTVSKGAGVISVEPLRNQPPPSGEQMLAAVAMTGFLRGLQPIFELQSWGVPIVYLPSARSHPLLLDAGAEAVMTEVSPNAFRSLWTKLADPSGGFLRPLMEGQAASFARRGLDAQVHDLVARARERRNPATARALGE